MKTKHHVRLILVSGTLISCLLVFLAGIRYGPGLTFDSINYLHAGFSLKNKGAFLRPMGEPFIEWPPLYPTLLAVLNIFSPKYLRSVFYFQIGITGLTVWLAGWLAARYIRWQGLFIAAFTALVFASPIILVNHFVWSEGVFVLLLVVYIRLLSDYVREPSRGLWWGITGIAALLCLQRHVGVFFIAGSLLLIWHFSTRRRVTETLLEGIMHGLLALVPIMLWWYRNYQVRGLIMNDYRPELFETPFLDHWLAYNSIFTSWLLPDEIPVWIRIVLVYGIVIALAIVYFRKAAQLSHKPYLVAAAGVLFLAYFVLTFTASLSVGEPMDDRILAPVYVPGIILLFVWLDTLAGELRYSYRRWLIAGCLLWSLYPVSRTLVNVYRWHHQPTPPPATQPIEPAFQKQLEFRR